MLGVNIAMLVGYAVCAYLYRRSSGDTPGTALGNTFNAIGTMAAIGYALDALIRYIAS